MQNDFIFESKYTESVMSGHIYIYIYIYISKVGNFSRG